MATNKMTYKTAIQYAIDNLPDAPADVREKWDSLLATLEKKNAAPKKVTAQQEANAALLAEAVQFLRDNAPQGFTVTEILKGLGREGDVSNQRLSALLQPKGIPAAGVRKETVKRRTLFFAVTEAV